MNAAVAAADRAAAIRRAARSWRRAGALDEKGLAVVEARWPDDRSRCAPGIRILLFVFTFIALLAAYGLLLVTMNLSDEALAAHLTLAAGISLVFATELLRGPLRRADGGIEEATSFLALLFLIVGGGWQILDTAAPSGGADRSWIAVHILAALACGAAAWRWGYRLYAAAGAVFVFLALARVPGGRFLWIALGVAVLPALAGPSVSSRLAPSHRRCLRAVLIVAAVALYLAVWIYSLDLRVVEAMGGRGGGADPLSAIGQLFTSEATGTSGISPGAGASPDPFGAREPVPWRGPGAPALPLRILSIAATALLPVLLAAWGIRSRRVGVLLLAALLGVVSLATARFYFHLIPLWAALAASGAGVIAAALLLRRWLEAGPGKERGGFTAEPLFGTGEARRALELAAATAVFSPPAQGPPAPGSDFKPGGGSAGGAGAGGEWPS